MLDTQKRGRVAAATAVAGGALAAVTIGAFASTGGTAANSAFTGCGYGYNGVGYSTGYGPCTSPSPSASPTAKPSTSPSPTTIPITNPCQVAGTGPSVKLDGGKIHKGQRKGLTARCLRPNRIVQVYAITSDGKTVKFAFVTVNKFGTVRIFYKATIKGSLTISFVGAQFDGKTLRKQFHTSIL